MKIRNIQYIGRLEVITGSMFSGKSEELIKRLIRAKYAKQNIVVFKHSIDKRYGDTGIFSHSNDTIDAYSASNVEDIEKILERYPDTEVIGIDEVQFFGNDIINLIKKYVELGKRIIVAGLDLDFKAEPFLPMPTLMAMADSVDKIHAICTICGKSAYASQRLINNIPAYYDDPLVLVGASENYEARCRRHHIVRYRENADTKLYFVINVDNNKYENKIIDKISKNKEYVEYVINENDKVNDIRTNIENLTKNNKIIIIKIRGSLLSNLEGNFRILDYIAEMRKYSEVILFGLNNENIFNNVMIYIEFIKNNDIPLSKIIYINEEKNECENIEKIEKLINIKGEII